MGGWGSKQSKIIIVGLDNSGKTTLINSLKPTKVRGGLRYKQDYDIVPTVGFGVEKFSKNKIDFTVFDMSGQSKYRTLWEQYYANAEVGFLASCRRSSLSWTPATSSDCL